MNQKSIKLIEIQDQWTDRTNDFPYIHSYKSNICFRLRSRITFDHEPILLIETLKTFDYLLPLKQHIDLAKPDTNDNFTVLRGILAEDGAWIAHLPDTAPGVISFQVVFVPLGKTKTVRFGTHDIILLCQDKFQLRKLRKMTVFPRCIGKYTEWQSFFNTQHMMGYNAFHLAPIQETGASNSYYSLKSHLQLSSQLFSGTSAQRNKQLKDVLTPLKAKGMVFFVDIILNHTSFDSDWVKDSPDAVFTYENTPMLYTAFLVDQLIFEWGEQVKEMLSFDVQLTNDILVQIQQNLLSRILHLKLHQFFQISEDMESVLLDIVPPRKPSENIFAKDPIESIQQFFTAYSTTPNSERRSVTVKDIQAWKTLDLAYQKQDLRTAIRTYNDNWKHRITEDWVPQIVRNTIGSVKYDYFENNYRRFDDPYPLVNKYFSKVNGSNGEFFALNNGWVGGADSRDMFAVSREYHYLRRRVHAWGDLLRIRYGDCPEDSPTAWTHMLEYVREMARYFDGFRMDNLHGTQLSVARYMIRQARRINPQLIVFAELFTSTDAETAVFVKQIGINSVLKEAQHMLSGEAFVRQFHQKIEKSRPYLGALDRIFLENGERIKYAVKKRPIVLVYDLTHDNQTFITKGIHVLQTPVSFALGLIGTFIGSTKGYDQFYSKKIDVTEMQKLYAQDICYAPHYEKTNIQAFLIRYEGKQKCSIFGSWDGWKQPHQLKLHEATQTYFTTLYLPPGHYEYKFKGADWFLQQSRPSNSNNNHQFTVPYLSSESRIIYRNLQQLRRKTAIYSQKYFHFKEYFTFHIGNIVVIIREPSSHLQSICVIVNLSTKQEPLPSQIGLVGNVNKAEIWLQSELSVYEGLTTQSEVAHSTNIFQFFQIQIDAHTGYDVLKAPCLPPGFACLLNCSKNSSQTSVIESLNQITTRPISLPPLGALDINILLFSCSNQQENIYGQSNYVIPQNGYKQLVYAGFAGVYQIIRNAKRQNSLSEGLFQNLRQGDWLLNFYLQRLRRHKHLQSLVEYLQRVFNLLTQLPRYLIPKYFSSFIYQLILAVEAQTQAKSDFSRKLAVSTCQFTNYFPNCNLASKVLLSAGLPHFAVGWARCWGRDTFTCTDLLLQHPNIFKQSILQFASALRHGLIPNLLDEGRRPRYNSRDACWWWVRAVSEYVNSTKDYQFLQSKVDMIFLSNDSYQHHTLKANGKTKVLALEQVVQQIFQAHTQGISFREWNSGIQIDANMSSDGFNINLEVDFDTGFIIGGNGFNCLTWMDKMGSSKHAGTKGIPATPRAGSPVELVGLLHHCLVAFQALHDQGHYSFAGVKVNENVVNFAKWASKIKQNFEFWYFLEEKQTQESVYIRGIYKDLVASPLHYDEQRFRPNALIALALSPEIFDQENAKSYIKKVENHLLHAKSIGMATLADVHSPFLSYYDNSDDSSNPKVAHGFSYHNGPQWVWLYGFYLVAKLKVEGDDLDRKRAMSLVQEHLKYIQKDEWCSLPEITNKNGEYNAFSCNAQAWSISSLLMALKHINRLPQ